MTWAPAAARARTVSAPSPDDAPVTIARAGQVVACQHVVGGTGGGEGRGDHTFAHFGYRKSSMDEVARAAGISRPGLYLLFSSKRELFREAALWALDRDLGAAERALAGDPPQIVEAFDHWAGRYIGRGRDLTAVVGDHPELLGAAADAASARFAALLTAALGDPDRAQTLISVSVGLKHQVETRADYRARLTVAVRLLRGRG
ncbi:TetR/AcrR family transcriptional regulator [Pseudonocardia oroxyli]|uniref:TetR/AcrR family transcriptional regulator n=1 Tax=Pseudonocardia oroxyli TaxID=366584 RepID=UPI001FE12712|nr:TetR/AcrR family transcriptional regulator [Pseudonocardia oroxyli]